MVSQKIKIMMVDDDPAAYLYHQIMMEDAGLDTGGLKKYTISHKALEDLKNCVENQNQEQWPDVLLVDLNMPQIDGWEFIAELEKLESPYGMPMIYLVSNSENPDDKNKVDAHPHVIDIKQKHLETSFFESLIEKF